MEKEEREKEEREKEEREKEEREKAYVAYIKTHQKHVQAVWAFVKEQEPFQAYQAVLDPKIDVHDASKFSQSEFEGYRQYFFSTKYEKKSQEQFLLAWNAHQKNNDHHWEYWIVFVHGKEHILEMNVSARVEMLCDWTAMSIHFQHPPSSYYDRMKNTIQLGVETRKCVEEWLPIFDKAYETLCMS